MAEWLLALLAVMAVIAQQTVFKGKHLLDSGFFHGVHSGLS